MTEIEKKALALLQECGFHGGYIDRKWNEQYEALCRSIEQHEAFKREVSDAVEEIAKVWGTADPAWGYLRRFILPKPVDPVIACLDAVNPDVSHSEADAYLFHEALVARGGRIVFDGEGQP